MPRYAVVLEDIVTAITADDPAVPGGFVLEMMGTKVFVFHSALDRERVVKPVSFAPLSRDQVIATAPLPGPGRREAGFRGGTAIVTGNFNSDTGRIEVEFLDPPLLDGIAEPFPRIELGPLENVLSGAITVRSDGSTIQVNSVDATILPAASAGPPAAGDARLPQLEPRNGFGIPIDVRKVPRSVDVPAGGGAMAAPLATINGYFAVPGQPVEGVAPVAYQGYDVVIDTVDRAALVDPLVPQIAVTKAKARRKPGTAFYDLDVQGGLTAEIGPIGSAVTRFTNPQRVALHRVEFDAATQRWKEDPVPLGFDDAVRVVPGKPFSKWQVRLLQLPIPPAPFDHPPTKVVARMMSPDAILANGGTSPVSPDGEERVEWIKG